MVPSRPSVTTCQGKNFPLSRSAVSAALCKPPQQGTSMRTMVTTRLAEQRLITVSYSV